MRRRRPCTAHRAAACFSGSPSLLNARVMRAFSARLGGATRLMARARRRAGLPAAALALAEATGRQAPARSTCGRRSAAQSGGRRTAKQFRRVGEPGTQLAQGHGAHAETAVALGIVGQRLQALDGMAEVGQHGTDGRDQRGGLRLRRRRQEHRPRCPGDGMHVRLEVHAQVPGERRLLAAVFLGDRSGRQAAKQVGVDLGTARMTAQRAHRMGHARQYRPASEPSEPVEVQRASYGTQQA